MDLTGAPRGVLLIGGLDDHSLEHPLVLDGHPVGTLVRTRCVHRGVVKSRWTAYTGDMTEIVTSSDLGAVMTAARAVLVPDPSAPTGRAPALRRWCAGLRRAVRRPG